MRDRSKPSRQAVNRRTLRFEIGSRILQRRKALGWKQRDLAQRIGARVARISRLENGHTAPSAAELLRLAETFGGSVDELLTGQPPKRPPEQLPEELVATLLEGMRRLERKATPEQLRGIVGCFEAIVALIEREWGRGDGKRPAEEGAHG